MGDIHKNRIITEYFEKTISEYLEFDVSELYEVADRCVIFGGCIRDIISLEQNHINDVDIITHSKSCAGIGNLLLCHGYTQVLLENDVRNSLYDETHLIFEPHTYTKGDKTVQLIRPSDSYVYDFMKIVSNVDLSSSGIYYDGHSIKESINNAIFLTMAKQFFVIEGALMYNESRVIKRKSKLLNRDWEEMGEIFMVDASRSRHILEYMSRQVNINYILYNGE